MNVSQHDKMELLLQREDELMLELERIPSKLNDMESLLQREEDLMLELEGL